MGGEGRVARVTGAARGIGRVISRVLAEAGAKVGLADRDVSVNRTAEVLDEAGSINGAEIRIDGGLSLGTGALGSRKEAAGSGA